MMSKNKKSYYDNADEQMLRSFMERDDDCLVMEFENWAIEKWGEKVKPQFRRKKLILGRICPECGYVTK